MCTYIHIYMYMYASIDTHHEKTYLCVYIHTLLRMCTAYIYEYIYVYNMYIYIYTQTHTSAKVLRAPIPL